jgi:hypothetical protein
MENGIYLYILSLGNSAVKFEQIVRDTIISIFLKNFRQLQSLIGVWFFGFSGTKPTYN